MGHIPEIPGIVVTAGKFDLFVALQCQSKLLHLLQMGPSTQSSEGSIGAMNLTCTCDVADVVSRARETRPLDSLRQVSSEYTDSDRHHQSVHIRHEVLKSLILLPQVPWEAYCTL